MIKVIEICRNFIIFSEFFNLALGFLTDFFTCSFGSNKANIKNFSYVFLISFYITHTICVPPRVMIIHKAF